MTRKRTGQIVRLDFWLWAGVVALSATIIAAREPVSPVDTSPVPTDERSPGGAGPRACDTDADCDDTNACTTDACVLGICAHRTIPDCVPCAPVLICPPLDVVFVLDTSASMKDEAMALCTTIDQIVNALSGDVDVDITVLGITEAPGGSFPCATDSVVNLLGGTVPGDSSTCNFPDDPSSYEAWGPATAIVAARFPWRDAVKRLIIPIGDEGPCNGSRPDGCNDPGDDRDSVTNAIAVAVTLGVTVSPVTGSGSDACVTDLADALASGTGGAAFRTNDAIVDIPTSIRNIILQTCEPDPSCDDGLFCTVGESCIDGVCGGGLPRDCSELNDDCNTGVCNKVSNACEREPTREGEPCDDGRFCRVDEVCNGGLCVGGHPRDCSHLDGDCTFGLCNEDVDFCEARPRREGRPCDDGDPCNVGELCQSGACIGGGPPDCSTSGDQCNTASCDPVGFEGNCDTVTPVPDGTVCDDGLFCVEGESCQGGICGGGSPHDCGFLDDQCNVGVCDDDTDACLRDPIPHAPCDDGENCTYLDACDSEGTCTGIDLNETPCLTNEECPAENTLCNTEIGLCECVDAPELCLNAQPGNLGISGVYEAGEEIVIHIALSPIGVANPVVFGGQFFIGYDPLTVEPIDVLPGNVVDPSSPFVLELDKSIDPIEGIISYAVGIDPFSGLGTVGPAVMAAIRLHPLVECQSIDDLCFMPDVSPTRTRLVDENGDNVPFVPGCCSGPLVINGEAPGIVCPADVSVDADAGGLTALVQWDPLILGGEFGFDCTAINDGGADISHLIEAGGVFPPGLSHFACTGTDSCGLEATCDWTVNVNPENVLEVTIELAAAAHCEGGSDENRACKNDSDCFEGVCVSDPYNGVGSCDGGGNNGGSCLSDLNCPDGTCAGLGLQRCVEFELFSTCVGNPLVVSETLEFGGPFNLARHVGPIEIKIPPGFYTCATARDPLHTLRSTAGLAIVDRKYVATFTGDPIFGGNWLVGGNLDGDFQIGFLDFLIFEGQDRNAADPNTPCGTAGPHADINGDGVVSVLDFDIINTNIGAIDGPGCCPHDDSPIPACPESVTRNADPGDVTALVTWDPVSASGGCGGSINLVCSGFHSNPDLDEIITQMWETGGRFPMGTSTFQCIATDICGLESRCRWSVDVTPETTVEVSLELSPPVGAAHCVGGGFEGEACDFSVDDCPNGECVSDSLQRCIEFEFFSMNCDSDPVLVQQTIEFGGPFNLPGRADHVMLKIPAGSYGCVTARDPLHTLRSSALTVIAEGRYLIDYFGDPFFDGNWLISGNLNGDHVIDMLDFGIFNWQYINNSVLDPDTPCGTEGPHSDMNGDGVVDPADWNFILVHQGAQDNNTCCGGSTASYPDPITEISISALEAMGLSNMQRADINGDGTLDQADIAAFEETRRPPRGTIKPAVRQPR